ncbi:MAG: hypothetical protein ACM3SP_19125 [Chloroflexota bacterium]
MKKRKMTQGAVALMLVAVGLTVPYALGVAHALTAISFGLVPASAGVANCLSQAKADVTVLHKEDTLGIDTLNLDARGLPADTDFAVFLTSADAFAMPSFGTVEYIGDFTTNPAGIGSLKVDAIVAEAFVDAPGTPRLRSDLDHLVFWFADPAQAQAACGVIANTPFDGDGHAGPAAMSSDGNTGLEQFPQQ